jgi:hypothetical protein
MIEAAAPTAAISALMSPCLGRTRSEVKVPSLVGRMHP